MTKRVCYLPCDRDASLLTRWLQSAGGLLEELWLELELEDADMSAFQPMLQALERNCGSLRRLDIRYFNHPGLAKAVLEKTHGRLHDLVTSDMNVTAVRRNSVGLRKLQFSKSSTHILGAFRAVGPTLESIQCCQPLTREDLKQVRCLCSNQSSISMFPGRDDDWTAYVYFLCSYDEQLRSAKLDNMPTALCEKIVVSCPTFRGDLSMFLKPDGSFSKMQALAPIVRALHVN